MHGRSWGLIPKMVRSIVRYHFSDLFYIYQKMIRTLTQAACAYPKYNLKPSNNYRGYEDTTASMKALLDLTLHVLIQGRLEWDININTYIYTD